MNEFDEFENYDPKAAEDRVKAGGVIPPGRYPATLIGAQKVESQQQQTPGWELKFRISDGIYEGREVKETLWITDATKDRRALFAHRLGLLKKKDDETGYVRVEGKVDFTDCLDTACVIETVLKPAKDDPSKKFANLAFCGVYKPDDPELKKPASGSKPAANTSTHAKSSDPSKSADKPAAEEKEKEKKTGKPKVDRGQL